MNFQPQGARPHLRQKVKYMARTAVRAGTLIETERTFVVPNSHFTPAEVTSLLTFYKEISNQPSHPSPSNPGKLDRLMFRDFLCKHFDLTDDVMMDLVFRAFDWNGDGLVDEGEFIQGLSIILRGSLDELIEFCYNVFDINGDRSLARDELTQCLRNCVLPGWGIDSDELDEAQREIIEMILKKLDVDKDGQITFEDFGRAVKKDPLLIQSVGQCLPSHGPIAGFLVEVTGNVAYRDLTTTISSISCLPTLPIQGKKIWKFTSLSSSVRRILTLTSSMLENRRSSKLRI